jgi:hypothetical protein
LFLLGGVFLRAGADLRGYGKDFPATTTNPPEVAEIVIQRLIAAGLKIG